MTAGTVIFVITIIVSVVILIGLWAVSAYNGLVAVRNVVQESWRQIDVELTRRHDLIPNLIEAVKGYAAHESSVFADVARTRAAASGAGTRPAAQARQEDALTQSLGRLFAVSENYPALRAIENFQQLQAELTHTEDRIAAGRRFYNANVRTLNTRVETFPVNVIANQFSFERAEYFEVVDPTVRAVPVVSF